MMLGHWVYWCLKKSRESSLFCQGWKVWYRGIESPFIWLSAWLFHLKEDIYEIPYEKCWESFSRVIFPIVSQQHGEKTDHAGSRSPVTWACTDWARNALITASRISIIGKVWLLGRWIVRPLLLFSWSVWSDSLVGWVGLVPAGGPICPHGKVEE